MTWESGQSARREGRMNEEKKEKEDVVQTSVSYILQSYFTSDNQSLRAAETTARTCM